MTCTVRDAAAQVVNPYDKLDRMIRGFPIRNSVVIEEQITVLIIEDDAAIADMYRLCLIADGYSVLIAETGPEGLRLATEVLPDFIYLDLRLPGLDGFEVLDLLRASPMTEWIPVMILSNYGDPELRERGLRLGASEFLVKADTTPRHLSDAVQRTTSGQQPISR